MKSSLSIFIVCLLASLQLNGQCYSRDWNNHWTSCQTQQSPNPQRGDGHWLMYDLGFAYTLGTSQIWNVNEAGNLGRGFKNVNIDYSLDGQNWTEWGSFQVAQGTGASDYAGSAGFDLDGLTARYLLITAVDNWGGTNCYGLSEIRFNIKEGTTPIEEISPENLDFQLAPNPTRSLINITLNGQFSEAIEIVIVNTLGQVLHRSQQTTPASGQTLSIALDNYQAGVYMMSVLQPSTGGVKTKPFVVVN
ncbi:MAG: discoidin domain-containing protein [Bacteroidota bacterium]